MIIPGILLSIAGRCVLCLEFDQASIADCCRRPLVVVFPYLALNDLVRLRSTPCLWESKKAYPYSIVSRKIHMVVTTICFRM